jgi:hypothetical protein
MTEEQPGDAPYDFQFTGYAPTWVAYEQSAERIREICAPHVGSSLVDIKGIVSSDGWEPDWPLILCFESGAVAINTKCDWQWAIDRWSDHTFDRADSDPDFRLLYVSLLGTLGVESLRGQSLLEIHWPSDRSYGIEQSFLFCFGDIWLRIFDAGDQLGVALLGTLPVDSERII